MKMRHRRRAQRTRKPGHFHFLLYPYQRALVDMLNEMRGRRAVFSWPCQCGQTAFKELYKEPLQ